jgi:hypothetical protein
MVIPSPSHDGVLPPFMPGAEPHERGAMSPYRTEVTEVVGRFSTSPERIEILRGLLDYREALRGIGVTDGFQWLDGSFVEECEKFHGRPPKDIDLITFATRPAEFSSTETWGELVLSRPDLFDPATAKEQFKCDAYFVDLGLPPAYLVQTTRYWFGLFSHQRETYLWKGMIEVPFTSDDSDASQLLEKEVEDATEA